MRRFARSLWLRYKKNRSSNDINLHVASMICPGRVVATPLSRRPDVLSQQTFLLFDYVFSRHFSFLIAAPVDWSKLHPYCHNPAREVFHIYHSADLSVLTYLRKRQIVPSCILDKQSRPWFSFSSISALPCDCVPTFDLQHTSSTDKGKNRCAMTLLPYVFGALRLLLMSSHCAKTVNLFSGGTLCSISCLLLYSPVICNVFFVPLWGRKSLRLGSDKATVSQNHRSVLSHIS